MVEKVGHPTSPRWILIAVVIGAIAMGPSAAAQSFQWWVPPKTEVAEGVHDLFMMTTIIAAIVFVLVQGALLYTLWRFRKNTKTPEGETHRGNTKAEITWTVIPAAILLMLGGVSASALFTMETPPSEPDFTIRVEAFQFGWIFIYPDGNMTINRLLVEEGALVALDVTSRDVIHSVWIPEFAIKLDAVPGRVNQQWFIAPEPAEYFLQCAEYCGIGHHSMHAKVVVFEADDTRPPWGEAPPPPPEPEEPEPDESPE